jgi:hypothetical protein
MTDDMARIVFEIGLGGERGRKLLLRSFFRLYLNGDDDAASAFLEEVIASMPHEDKEHVMFVISEVTSALAFQDG